MTSDDSLGQLSLIQVVCRGNRLGEQGVSHRVVQTQVAGEEWFTSSVHHGRDIGLGWFSPARHQPEVKVPRSMPGGGQA
jgi:hypothetical protein